MFKKGESGFKGRKQSTQARALISAWSKANKAKGIVPKQFAAHLFKKGHGNIVGQEGYRKASIAKTGQKRTQSAIALMRSKHIAALKAGKYSRGKDTDIERMLAAELEKRGISFEKQVALAGISIVDFYISEYRLVIEADGDYWHSLPRTYVRDIVRDFTLKKHGFQVLRFSGTAIKLSAAFCVSRILDQIALSIPQLALPAST